MYQEVLNRVYTQIETQHNTPKSKHCKNTRGQYRLQDHCNNTRFCETKHVPKLLKPIWHREDSKSNPSHQQAKNKDPSKSVNINRTLWNQILLEGNQNANNLQRTFLRQNRSLKATKMLTIFNEHSKDKIAV